MGSGDEMNLLLLTNLLKCDSTSQEGLLSSQLDITHKGVLEMFHCLQLGRIKPPNLRLLRQRINSQIRGRNMRTDVTHIQWGLLQLSPHCDDRNTNRIPSLEVLSPIEQDPREPQPGCLTLDSWSNSLDWNECHSRGCSEKKCSLCWTHRCYFLKLFYYCMSCVCECLSWPHEWVVTVAKARVWLMCDSISQVWLHKSLIRVNAKLYGVYFLRN